MFNRKERNELDSLSKEVFGTSSRWKKLVDKGHLQMVTEEKTETVPPAKEGEEATVKTVQVPTKTAFGAHQFSVKCYTLESIKEYMLQQKQQIADIKEQIKKHQEEVKAKQEADALANKVHLEGAGSVKV